MVLHAAVPRRTGTDAVLMVQLAAIPGTVLLSIIVSEQGRPGAPDRAP